MKRKRTGALFAAAAALGLLVLRVLLAPAAERTTQAELDSMLRTLLPGSQTFVTESFDSQWEQIRTVYKGETGFVVETQSAGYAGEITMLVGVRHNGSVSGLVVRDLEETYGLGGRALYDTRFLSQFLNTRGAAEVGTTIDALTGATVTSKAIARGVNAAVAYVTGADSNSGATQWGG